MKGLGALLLVALLLVLGGGFAVFTWLERHRVSQAPAETEVSLEPVLPAPPKVEPVSPEPEPESASEGGLGQVAEGIYTLKLVKEKSEAIGIYMPLVRGLYEILYDGASISAVINSLMMSVQNSDVEFILPRTPGRTATHPR